MNRLLRILTGLIAIAFLISPDVTHADDYNARNCGWPLLLSPEGPANSQGPDDAARYWIMPLDTTQYRAMTIHGKYPHLRYFAIAAYEVVAKGSGYDFEVGDPLYDAEIIPDQGANPFVKPGGSNGTYAVEISHGDFQTATRAGAVPKGVLPNKITVTAHRKSI